MFDFDITCRVCLESKMDLKCIFTSYNSLNSLSDFLYKCAGVSVSKDDGLPSLMCETCICDLTAACSFVQKCQESDKKLREYIISMKNEEVSIKVEVKMEANSDSEQYYSKAQDNDSDSDENVIPRGKILATMKTHKKEKVKTNRKSTFLKKHKCSLQCGTCGLRVPSQSALTIHERTHSGEKPFSCHFCGTSFSQKSTLSKHIQRKHSNAKLQLLKRQVCDNCGKTFVSSTNLKIHMRIHTGELPYACDYCPKRFVQRSSCLSHTRTHTGEKPNVCKICGKAFKEANHLKRHQAVHTQDRPFVCNICGKGVKSAFALKQHLKLHTNFRKHVCDQCGLALSNKGNLDAHIRVVHSEKSGQCVLCRKMCSNLADHMLDHTGEKPYQCEICSKTFSHNRGLIVHLRQHTSAGKYRCNVEGCDKSFSVRWVLDCHVMKHTGKSSRTCQYCNKGFLRVCHYTKHMKLNHPEVSNELPKAENT